MSVDSMWVYIQVCSVWFNIAVGESLLLERSGWVMVSHTGVDPAQTSPISEDWLHCQSPTWMPVPTRSPTSLESETSVSTCSPHPHHCPEHHSPWPLLTYEAVKLHDYSPENFQTLQGGTVGNKNHPSSYIEHSVIKLNEFPQFSNSVPTICRWETKA